VATTLFKTVDYPLSRLIQDIEFGEIGLPEIQRPFVWKATKVRDLFDSMYKGFPVGYLVFWANDYSKSARQIGVDAKQVDVARLLIVDGQQRLTALYAVIKRKPVLTRDFREVYLNIAFRPRDAKFEVSDAAIRRDPEYIPNISELWTNGSTSYTFVKSFLENLRQSRRVGDEEEEHIGGAIARLDNLQNYPFTALEISSTADEEEVADVFVRINSQGIKLRQADFILTLLSVFWDRGRAALEEFARESRRPAADGNPSPYNHFIQPDPDQLLRVSVALGFKRARLRHVYSLLRGKDLETGQFSDERREEQFALLRKAQMHVLNLQDWHDFLKVLVQAGFRSGSMVSSETGLLYTYAMYLIGKHEYKVEPFRLRNLMARWFFMTALTGRYTGSPETVMDQDLARLRGVADAGEFCANLERLIEAGLPNDYWDVMLVSELETAAARSPAMFAYYAALNLLDARVLFSKMKVSELLDPALRGQRRAIERHHLFPRGHLKRLGYESMRETNQVANYALAEWGDNADIGDESPSSYFPRYAARFDGRELDEMMAWHALPEGWCEMQYEGFLAERRKRMAQVVRQGFERLSGNCKVG
jgi:hypothetical protein